MFDVCLLFDVLFVNVCMFNGKLFDCCPSIHLSKQLIDKYNKELTTIEDWLLIWVRVWLIWCLWNESIDVCCLFVVWCKEFVVCMFNGKMDDCWLIVSWITS